MGQSQRRTATRAIAVTAIGVAGFVLLALAALRTPLASLALAVAAGVLAELQRARVRADVAASLINVALLAAVVLAGPWVLVGVALGGAVGAWSTYPSGTEARIERLAFNFGQLAIAGLVAGFLFEALVGSWHAEPGAVGAHLLLPLLVAAVVFTLVNVVFLAIIVWISTGERPRSLLGSLGPILLMQPAFVAYALVAVALVDVHPLALALLAVPVLLSRSAYAAFEEVTEATESLLRTLITLIEQRDGYTRGHAERVAELAVLLARDLGYSHDDVQTVRQSALLHDLGKICVPIEVIRKPGRLTRDEFDEIRLHPLIGARVLADVEALGPALPGIRHHHERVDGGGYPDGLIGDEIPEFVRVVSIADAFDAMTSTRSYRKALTVEEALGRLVEAAGTQFDGTLVQRFTRLIERQGWEPTLAPAASWPTIGDVEAVDNCCAPTLSEQFGAVGSPRPPVLAEGSTG